MDNQITIESDSQSIKDRIEKVAALCEESGFGVDVFLETHGDFAIKFLPVNVMGFDVVHLPAMRLGEFKHGPRMKANVFRRINEAKVLYRSGCIEKRERAHA